MIQYLPEFLTVAAVHLLAVVSPGPDFALITRNSLVYSRRVGIYSAIGLGLGIATHVVYSLLGIGLIISQSIVLFSIIKLLGAGYLIYIGYKCLRSKPQEQKEDALLEKKTMSTWQSIRMGYITNVLNPKATLFIFSVFTQVINPHTPLSVQIVYGAEMSVVTFFWFGFVSIIFGASRIKKLFARFQHKVEKVMGAVLVALGVRLAFLSHK